ncbi:hypothetical protein JAAARDRAFT_704834 [Jaapia argillacea MUCL 33604]|uniref:Uncharacterized protein n=1 Tax=Jaapia argillacea MUCL 33604 TaxID=933084 RepID=A0A067Q5S7_9AGAM|nr:hypothetical protein JAAARDRAFT_704834 [Jaapia argillacea MUCL 33604]
MMKDVAVHRGNYTPPSLVDNAQLLESRKKQGGRKPHRLATRNPCASDDRVVKLPSRRIYDKARRFYNSKLTRAYGAIFEQQWYSHDILNLTNTRQSGEVLELRGSRRGGAAEPWEARRAEAVKKVRNSTDGDSGTQEMAWLCVLGSRWITKTLDPAVASPRGDELGRKQTRKTKVQNKQLAKGRVESQEREQMKVRFDSAWIEDNYKATAKRPHDTPAIITPAEPQPLYPSYEKWTHWNAFDPDADEFFERDDAVYEAFVNPGDLQTRRRTSGEGDGMMDDGSDASRSRSPSPIRRAPVVIEETISSGSSEGSDSGRDSPMVGVVGETDAGNIAYPLYYRSTPDPGLDLAWMEEVSRQYRRDTEATSRDRPSTPPDRGRDRVVLQPGEMVSQYANMYNIVSRGTDAESDRRVIRVERERVTTVGSPVRTRTSDITPIPVHVNRSPPIHMYAPHMPSTPPPLIAPSPPPTVTPRLYSWSTPPTIAVPTSPTRLIHAANSGPLTNPSARMSLTHITPSRNRVRRVIA